MEDVRQFHPVAEDSLDSSVLLGRCPGKNDWLEFHVHIHHTRSSSTQQRVDKSLRLGRPSAGPRKPLITGSSCLQCRPLIVLSENRCGCLLPSAACLTEFLNRPLSQGPLCHVVLLKHPAPIGGHLNSLPTPYGLRLFEHHPITAPHCKKKKSISNKVETGFPLHPRKAHLRVWVNTFMPWGPDEIKHQRHALYVSKKHWPCLLHLTIWVLHVHVCWTQLHTAVYSHIARSEVLQKANSLLTAYNLNASNTWLPSFSRMLLRSKQSRRYFPLSCVEKPLFLSTDDKMVSQGGTNASTAGEQTNSISRRVLGDWYSSLICLNSLKCPPSSPHPTPISYFHPPPFAHVVCVLPEPWAVVEFPFRPKSFN